MQIKLSPGPEVTAIISVYSFGFGVYVRYRQKDLKQKNTVLYFTRAALIIIKRKGGYQQYKEI